MHISAVKTPLIKSGDDLQAIFRTTISSMNERTIVTVASKAFSTSEGRFVAKKTGERAEKYELARREADYYLDPHSSKYGLMLTIKRNWMFMFAGIDESNADNQYLLWPADPQQSVNRLWRFLRSHYGVKEVGVIMTDSSSLPLNWGVVGHAIAYCGFSPLKSYVGKPDLFGRPMRMEQLNIMQCLASAAVVEMGEGNESQPIALCTELPTDVEFQDHEPTAEELAGLQIELEDDAYAPLLQGAQWKKGKK